MASLRTRLSTLEEEFASSLSKGEDAISTFYERWQQVVEEVDALAETGSLDRGLSMLVHIVATRIATLAEISLEIVASRDNLTTELVGELDLLMSELSISDCPPPIAKSPSSLQSPMDIAPPSATPCRKRRKGSEVPLTRPLKRSRGPPYISSSSEANAVPMFTTHVTSTETVTLPVAAPSSSRKRRLSESDTSASTTLPGAKRLYIGPRPHAVSDSFVCSRDHEWEPYPFTVPSLITCNGEMGGTPSIEPSGPLDIQPFDFMPNLMSFVDDLPLSQLDLSVDLDLCNVPLQLSSPETSAPLPNIYLRDLSPFGRDISPSSKTSEPILDAHLELSYLGRSPSPTWTAAESVDSAPSPPSLPSYPVTPPLHPSYKGLCELETCILLPEVETSLFPSSLCDEQSELGVDWTYLLNSSAWFPCNTSHCTLPDVDSNYPGRVLDVSAGEARG